MINLLTEKEFNQLNLNKDNHLINNNELLNELFKVKFEENLENKLKSVGQESRITAWQGTFSFNNINNEPLVYIIYKNYWIPFVEYNLLVNYIDKYQPEIVSGIDKLPKVANLTIGYIDGRQHHLGKLAPDDEKDINLFPGYSMWCTLDLFEEKE